MKSITTISLLPPPIQQFFNNVLLGFPVCKFYDDCEVLWGIYQYILTKLKPKCVKNKLWFEKVERLESKFLELYGRAQAKEDEFKEKTGKPFGEPFYHFRETGRNHPKLFGRLKFKRTYSSDSFMRKDYAF